MRNVILYIAMSLDGYIADKDGGVGWLSEGQDNPAAESVEKTEKETAGKADMKRTGAPEIETSGSPEMKNAGSPENETADSYESFLQEIDTVIMGWNTYHQVVTELSPSQWPYAGLSSYVITHRKIAPSEPAPAVSFTDEDTAALIRRLRTGEGRGIWICGGASVVRQLMEQDLIDEYRISLIPILLGGGIPLFPAAGRPLPLEHTATRVYGAITEVCYVRRRP